MNDMQQLSIFKAVQDVYARHGDTPIDNATLYDEVSARVGVTPQAFRARTPVGRSGARHSRMTRTARFVQQTMKSRGWLSKQPGARGVWKLTDAGRAHLHTPAAGQVVLGFSTRLGIAMVGDCRSIFERIDAPIALTLVSPPYLLAKARRYGNPAPGEYVDFVLRCLEPVVRRMLPGANLALNIGVDSFAPLSPARTLHIERLTLALCDELGLHLMDRLPWHNTSKPPTPVQWASIKRMQLNSAYEMVLLFCTEPLRSFADNRRVLQPISTRQAKLVAGGGEKRIGVHADGAHRTRIGSFGKPTAGTISRNILAYSHTCASQRLYKRRAREMGLPCHGAPMPLELAKFLIQWLTAPGQLVVDPMAGSMTTALAAELLGRPWIAGELHAEYALGGSARFDGAWINPVLGALTSHTLEQGHLDFDSPKSRRRLSSSPSATSAIA